MLKLLFGLSGVSMVALGAGVSSTVGSTSDTNLGSELIANATRLPIGKTSSTAGSFVALDSSSVVDDVTIISGVTYEKKLECRAIFPTTDGNNGNPFRRYALFSTNTLPGTPAGTSGTMFNVYVAGSDINKDASTEIDVDVTIRF